MTVLHEFTYTAPHDADFEDIFLASTKVVKRQVAEQNYQVRYQLVFIKKEEVKEGYTHYFQIQTCD